MSGRKKFFPPEMEQILLGRDVITADAGEERDEQTDDL